MIRTKSMYEKYRIECLRDIPDATDDEIEYYVRMRFEEHEERFKYEDGDHFEEYEPRMPEYDYPR